MIGQTTGWSDLVVFLFARSPVLPITRSFTPLLGNGTVRVENRLLKYSLLIGMLPRFGFVDFDAPSTGRHGGGILHHADQFLKSPTSANRESHPLPR
jgi:hypothetical protein